jgi:hypothetical protein
MQVIQALHSTTLWRTDFLGLRNTVMLNSNITKGQRDRSAALMLFIFKNKVKATGFSRPALALQ